MLQAQLPELPDDESEELARWILSNSPSKVGNPRAYLRRIIKEGDLRYLHDDWRGRNGSAAALGVDLRPPWCGVCDERTRQIEDDDARPSPCPACSPRAAAAARQAEAVAL